jgi:hypothetical protein
MFLFTTASGTVLGPTQRPILWVPGALSLGVKRPEREADHSPPSTAEVKTAWSYTSTPQYVFMAWCLVKHRDKFTSSFFFYYELLGKNVTTNGHGPRQETLHEELRKTTIISVRTAYILCRV